MALWLSTLELAVCGYALYKEAAPGAANLDSQVDSFMGGGAKKTALSVSNSSSSAILVGSNHSDHVDSNHSHHSQPSSVSEALFTHCHLEDSLGKQVGIKMWIYVQIGLAAINWIFAPYFQCRLWYKLKEEAGNEQEGALQVSQESVKKSFQHVFLHDFGVLFYVIALGFSWWWSNKGMVWAYSDPVHCNPQFWISRAASFGLFFFWFTILYACGWFCYMSCMASGEVLLLRGRAPSPPYQKAPMSAQSPEAPPPRSGTSAPQPNVMGGTPEPPMQAPQDPGCFGRLCRARQLMKLLACIGLDLMGNASYFLPAAGEVGDAAWAPAQAVMLQMMFNANGIALLGFVEELLPFSDALPTATIAWCLETFLPDHPFSRALGISPNY